MRDYSPPAEKITAMSRSRKYGAWRACERVSPLDIFGEPLEHLTLEQVNDLMAYSLIRQLEEQR